jgi:uncharacterized protein
LKKKIIIRWIKIIVLLYCVAGLVLYYMQDKILFRPEALPADHAYNFTQPHQEVNIPYDPTSNINIIQFKPATQPPKGVVLYFHGNRKNISWYANYADSFTRRGYEVWMPDYPGYGKSTGEFTEQRLYDWALQTYKLARVRFNPDSIIIYGKSLGTGIAAQLASVRDCKYLLLETPYYDFPSVIGQYAPVYPLGSMIRYKIPTYKYLKSVTAPVIVFHGTSDGVIRHSNGKKLQPFLKPGDQFISIEGGSHNDLTTYDVYKAKIDSLLAIH